jgi:hypothetical protein
MSNDVFAARLQRIANGAPNAHVAIPGQVGEPERKEIKIQKSARRQAIPYRRASQINAMLFGGICGALAGLLFQHIVGFDVFFNFDWEAEMALIEADLVRAASWGAVAAGATLCVLSLPSYKRFRKMAIGSLAYVSTAVGVNAQEILALLPTTAS